MSARRYPLRKRPRPTHPLGSLSEEHIVESSDSSSSERSAEVDADVDGGLHVTPYPCPEQPWSDHSDIPQVARYMILKMYHYEATMGRERGARKHIARTFGLPASTVYSLIATFKASGTMAVVREGQGRSLSLQQSVRNMLRDACYRYIEAKAASNESAQATTMLRDLVAANLAPTSLQYRSFLDYLVRFDLINTDARAKRFESLAIKTRTLRLRREYFMAIQSNRAKPKERRRVEVYQDESYVHNTHQRRLSWGNEHQPNTLRSRTVKGRRLCFSAAITERGLLEGSLWVFSPQAKSKDYHRSFNAANFLPYFRGEMKDPDGAIVGLVAQFEASFPGQRALFIMDNAAYHKCCTDAPTGVSCKAELRQYLSTLGVATDEYWSRSELYELCAQHKEERGCDVQRYARDRGHRVLFLPPHYSRWNPIELYWAAAKNAVAELYTARRGLDETRRQLLEALQRFGTAEHAAGFVEHATNDMMDTMRAESRSSPSGSIPGASEGDIYYSEEDREDEE